MKWGVGRRTYGAHREGAWREAASIFRFLQGWLSTLGRWSVAFLYEADAYAREELGKQKGSAVGVEAAACQTALPQAKGGSGLGTTDHNARVPGVQCSFPQQKTVNGLWSTPFSKVHAKVSDVLGCIMPVDPSPEWGDLRGRQLHRNCAASKHMGGFPTWKALRTCEQ